MTANELPCNQCGSGRSMNSEGKRYCADCGSPWRPDCTEELTDSRLIRDASIELECTLFGKAPCRALEALLASRSIFARGTPGGRSA